MSLWETSSVNWSNWQPRPELPRCRSCNKECKVTYVFVPSTDVSIKTTCANCMKSKDSVKDNRLFLLSKYERHLNSLTDDEVVNIIEKVKNK